MTKAKCLQLIDRYKRLIENQEISSGPIPANVVMHFELVTDQIAALSHVSCMLPIMRQFVEANEVGKFMRWLGFVQGVLWSTGQYTLSDLMLHSREVR